jgi:hypothetical protein
MYLHVIQTHLLPTYQNQKLQPVAARCPESVFGHSGLLGLLHPAYLTYCRFNRGSNVVSVGGLGRSAPIDFRNAVWPSRSFCWFQVCLVPRRIGVIDRHGGC